MAKSQVTQDIKSDIAAGNLGLARQRLHSLVDTYPEDLSLRKRLGDIYHRLQYPERAGCFWYLEERKTPEMERACAEFVRACGGNPQEILRRLKVRGGVDTLPHGFARMTLQNLASRAPGYRFPTTKKLEDIGRVPSSLKDQVKDTVNVIGCGLAAFAVLMVFVFGIITLYMFARGYGFEK